MLSRQQAKAFYDRFGKKQDWQSFYEDRAVEAMIRHGAFSRAGAVFEFGCGTGRFAETLLEKYLPSHAKYVGVDISETMVALTTERLARFGPRANVRLTDGSPRFDVRAASFDRFVSNYVLDLLAFEDIRKVIQEAERLLADGGLLCLVSLTHGFTPVSRIVERLWRAAYAIRPTAVGGCRPISLLEFVAEPIWRVRHHGRYSSYGVPSEVIVAENDDEGIAA
jgi:ubiquinone/menaquinone biosynthesis C-methylase UbiE